MKPGALKTQAPGIKAGRGFTLLEVMIALGILAIAMLALLSLHHQDLRSVIRAQELTQATMLAQALMTKAELEGFPNPGKTSGNFQAIYPGRYPNFRWQQVVEQSAMFPDVRKVEVTIFYGAGFRHTFTLTEFLHSASAGMIAPPGTRGGPNSPAAPGEPGSPPLGQQP